MGKGGGGELSYKANVSKFMEQLSYVIYKCSHVLLYWLEKALVDVTGDHEYFLA